MSQQNPEKSLELVYRPGRSLATASVEPPAEPFSPREQALRVENERLQREAGRYYRLYEDIKQQHNDEIDRWRDHTDSYKIQLGETKERLRRLEATTGKTSADLEKEIEDKKKVEDSDKK
ncbi:Nn.00g000270.m01.CDS01 [Neocucurbitaria sp. VM-36]